MIATIIHYFFLHTDIFTDLSNYMHETKYYKRFISKKLRLQSFSESMPMPNNDKQTIRPTSFRAWFMNYDNNYNS